MPFLVLIFF